MSISPNFQIVTLGVKDLARSIAFYRALGWEQRGAQSDGICWFKTSGSWVGLFGYDALAADADLVAEDAPAEPAEQPGYRGFTLAVNLSSIDEVDAAFVHAESIGAPIVKPPRMTDWGGYSGYFADPDGNLWEIAFNPGFPIDANGRIEIGG